MANSDGWWGEGNDNWYVDGSTKPTISGTGSEDYFCGAWDFGHTFQTPYFGVTYYDNNDFGGEKRGIQNTVYRWHIQDPCPLHQIVVVHVRARRRRLGRGPYALSKPPYTTVGLYYGDGTPRRRRPHPKAIPRTHPPPPRQLTPGSGEFIPHRYPGLQGPQAAYAAPG